MPTRFNPLSTLIVDDSEMECQLLRAQLGQLGWVSVLDCVHDGLEVIEYLRRTNPFTDRQTRRYPDLILLDFKMPRCDGIEVLGSLQHQLRRPRIVLWSTALDQIDVPLAYELGADLVCSKPAGLAELVDILRRLEARVCISRSIAPRRRTAETGPIHA